MKRSIVMIILAASVIAVSGCREPREEISPDVKSEADEIEKDKNLIAAKLADIERSRVLLETNSEKELEQIRTAIESINQALRRIEARLVAMGAVTEPTQPAKRKPLHPAVIAALVAFFLGSTVLYVKLRRMRLRESRQTRAEVIIRDKPKAPPES